MFQVHYFYRNIQDDKNCCPCVLVEIREKIRKKNPLILKKKIIYLLFILFIDHFTKSCFFTNLYKGVPIIMEGTVAKLNLSKIIP